MLQDIHRPLEAVMHYKPAVGAYELLTLQHFAAALSLQGMGQHCYCIACYLRSCQNDQVTTSKTTGTRKALRLSFQHQCWVHPMASLHSGSAVLQLSKEVAREEGKESHLHQGKWQEDEGKTHDGKQGDGSKDARGLEAIWVH